jgi:hypothetical protein
MKKISIILLIVTCFLFNTFTFADFDVSEPDFDIGNSFEVSEPNQISSFNTSEPLTYLNSFNSSEPVVTYTETPRASNNYFTTKNYYPEASHYPNYFAPNYARQVYDEYDFDIPYYSVPSYGVSSYYSSPTYYSTPSYSSVPYYSVGSNYSVPSYSVNTNFSVPSYNVQSYNVPSYNLANPNLNFNTGNIKTIETVKKYEVTPTTVNYYPNNAVNVGTNYVNNAVQNGQKNLNTWQKNLSFNKNTVWNASHGEAMQSGEGVAFSKDWLLKNGKHTAITKVALANGNGSFIMQGACIDGCAPGVGGYFEWGTNPNYLAARTDLVSAGGNMVNNFSQKLTGLKAGTIYYYRAIIQDRNGNKRIGKLMSYTVPYFKNTTTTGTVKNNTITKTNGTNTGTTVKQNTVGSSGAIVTQNGANTIIVVPDGRTIVVDANGKATTVNGNTGNVGTCNCMNDLVNQNNIGNTNGNTVKNLTNTSTTTESVWTKISNFFFGKAKTTTASVTGQNIQTVTQNTANNVTDTAVKTGYSWYEWILLFVLLFVFIGALRYLWKAFGKSSSAMH